MVHIPNFESCKGGRRKKHPPKSNGRITPTRQGHCQKRNVRRKHEAEPVYAANSEPAIWHRGAGRAGLKKRAPVFERAREGMKANRCGAGRDTGRVCILLREALLYWRYDSCRSAIKLRSRGRPRSREGTEGGRFTGSTYNTGPMKPGNGVEDKTLSIGKETRRGRGRIGRTRHLWQLTHILPEHMKRADTPGLVARSACCSPMRPGCRGVVTAVWEAVDERRQ
jgi:hypothetical protein